MDVGQVCYCGSQLNTVEKAQQKLIQGKRSLIFLCCSLENTPDRLLRSSILNSLLRGNAYLPCGFIVIAYPWGAFCTVLVWCVFSGYFCCRRQLRPSPGAVCCRGRSCLWPGPVSLSSRIILVDSCAFRCTCRERNIKIQPSAFFRR